MKDDKKLDAVLERFYNVYNKYNTKVLEKLGETIKKFDGLTPSQAHQLAQELKYSKDADELLEELSKISGKSVKDIDILLTEVAKENIGFAEAYNKKNKKLSYKDNAQIKRYVETIKQETNGTFKDLSKSKNIGFTIKDKKGKSVFKPFKRAYRDLIDEAVYNVSSGVVDYQSAMRHTMKQLANSGIKIHEATTTYTSGYSRRIDSSVRQAVLQGIRQINIGVQREVGEELGANGIEISAHSPCAEDHLDIQGKQFFAKKGETLEQLTNRVNSTLDRPIGQLNCKHFIFSIIKGVNLPSYTKEMLEEMEEQSMEEVSYKGKKYTRYEATQVQRKMETAIRREKDNQIIARASGDEKGIAQAQKKIKQITKEYTNFSNATGLDVYKERMAVSGYRRVKTK